MKFQIVALLLSALLALFVPVQSRPTNSMTRIQEVFRTLNFPKPMFAQRGKKSVMFARPPMDLDNYRLVYLADPVDPLFEDN